jgi:TRAP-type C4-dicarboxylate transport system permease small subunit
VEPFAMRRRKKSQLLLICILSLLAFSLLVFGTDKQVMPEKQNQQIQTQQNPEKIIPSPKNIKERTAIYVFIGWMWVSIFVLIYILAHKIKESDRIYKYKFFSEIQNK